MEKRFWVKKLKEVPTHILHEVIRVKDPLYGEIVELVITKRGIRASLRIDERFYDPRKTNYFGSILLNIKEMQEIGYQKYEIEDMHSIISVNMGKILIFSQVPDLIVDIKKEILIKLFLIEQQHLYTLYEVFKNYNF